MVLGSHHRGPKPKFYNGSHHSVLDVLHYETIFTLRERRHGAVVIHTFICLYCFVALAILCDHYFCASLEKLCKRLRIPTDVAGATFMAAGSSMPTLFISIASVFMGEGDIGLGTIIGSTMFNILFITAICGLLSGMVITLHTWPIIRDSVVYIINLIGLLIVIQDSVIHFYEALIFPVFYAAYILVMVWNTRLEEAFESVCGKYFNINKGMEMIEMDDPLKLLDSDVVKEENESESGGTRDSDRARMRDIDTDSIRDHNTERMRDTSTVRMRDPESENSGGEPDAKKSNDGSVEKSENKNNYHDTDSNNKTEEKDGDLEGSYKSISKEESKRNDEDLTQKGHNVPSHIHGFEPTPPLKPPDTFKKRALWFIMLPVHFIFYMTMPDCRVKKWEAWYPVTFGLSIIWMAALSYVLVWTVSIIGETFSIPECIMGLTLLAAGSSVPDVMSSLIVAKHGLGDMALANCIGSNIFDVLCLGLPWLLATTAVHPNSIVLIHSGHIVYVSLCLFGTVFAIVAAIHLNGWKLDKRLGVILIVVYLAFLTTAVVLEALPGGPGGQGKEAKLVPHHPFHLPRKGLGHRHRNSGKT